MCVSDLSKIHVQQKLYQFSLCLVYLQSLLILIQFNSTLIILNSTLNTTSNITKLKHVNCLHKEIKWMCTLLFKKYITLTVLACLQNIYITLTVLAYLQNKRGSSGQNQRTLHTFSVKVHPPLPAWGPSGQWIWSL